MRHLLTLTLVLLAGPAFAHGGEVHDHPTAWIAEPWVIAPLVTGGALYLLGLVRLWQGAGRRGTRPWRAALFGAGFMLTALLLLSPLESLTDRFLSAHMIQHFALMLIAAPLMVLGRPGFTFLWAFPRAWRGGLARIGRGPLGRIWRVLTHPVGAWLAYFVVLWLWHAPPLYQRAVLNDGVHALQHASFLAAAMIFWSAVIGATTPEGRAGALLAMFATAVQSCALAALMTMSQIVWYPIYAQGAGLSALQDQQLAGLIMWVPCCALMIGAAVAVMARLLRETERRNQRLARS